MSASDPESPPTIIYDIINNIVIEGKFAKAMIVKTKPPTNMLIFSDNLEISRDRFYVKGLHVGVIDGKAISEEKETVLMGDLSKIDFCVLLSKDVVGEFDAGRFSTNYPNIIRFLHTACLYNNKDNQKIDHIQFVAGEILNKPVAVGKNIAIVGDRVVIDENREPTFYDCIIIKRDETNCINLTFEPFYNLTLAELDYILLLGVENF
jgi:hypothetical protein